MKSIKTRIICVAVALAFVPISITSLYLFANLKNNMLETSINNVNFYMKNIEDEVNLVMESLEYISFSILSSDDVKNTMQNWDTTYFKTGARREIENSIKYNHAWDSKVVNSVFLFKDSQEYIYESRLAALYQTEERNVIAYEQYKDFRSFNKLVQTENNDNYAYYILDIFDTVVHQNTGKLIVEVVPSQIFDLDNIIGVYPNAEIYLSVDDNIIYKTTESEFDRHKIEDGTVPMDGILYYHYASSDIDTDLNIDILIPRDDIYYEYNRYIKLLIAVTFLMVCLSTAVAYFFYKTLTEPLDKIESSMDLLKSGDFSVRLEEVEYKELNKIAMGFNDMADNMGYLFAEVYEKGKELSQIELIMLQSQINPHFIFNVLEAINMKALENKDEKISEMIRNLAKLMRSNILLKGQQMITIKQEIDYVTYYLSLQKERFGFSYNISYEDDDILETYIPKLIIQPLIENSIVHGFNGVVDNAHISINIWSEDEIIYIKVSDNGVGFDNTKAQINNYNETESHNNLALVNITRRLELLYNKDFEFDIKSEIGKGTTIVISVPINKEKSDV